MCTGAAYWADIGPVVYGLLGKGLSGIIRQHSDNLCLDVPCQEILKTGQRHIEVIGSLLEKEAAQPHNGFWN